MYLFQSEYLQIREIKSQINNKREKRSCEQTVSGEEELLKFSEQSSGRYSKSFF